MSRKDLLVISTERRNHTRNFVKYIANLCRYSLVISSLGRNDNIFVFIKNKNKNKNKNKKTP